MQLGEISDFTMFRAENNVVECDDVGSLCAGSFNVFSQPARKENTPLHKSTMWVVNLSSLISCINKKSLAELLLLCTLLGVYFLE